MLTPSTVKTYLQGCQRASLSEIAIHFGSSADAVRQLLTLWLDKGRIRRLDAVCSGKSCSCARKNEDLYEWVR